MKTFSCLHPTEALRSSQLMHFITCYIISTHYTCPLFLQNPKIYLRFVQMNDKCPCFMQMPVSHALQLYPVLQSHERSMQLLLCGVCNGCLHIYSPNCFLNHTFHNIKHCNPSTSLPAWSNIASCKAVQATSLQVSKSQPVKVLSNLLWTGCWTSWDTFQPELNGDSMIALCIQQVHFLKTSQVLSAIRSIQSICYQLSHHIQKWNREQAKWILKLYFSTTTLLLLIIPTQLSLMQYLKHTTWHQILALYLLTMIWGI